MTKRSSMIAEAAGALVASLESPEQLLDVLRAAASGDLCAAPAAGRPGLQLVPFGCPDPTLGPDAPWLGFILISILHRAGQLGLPSGPLAAGFAAEFNRLFEALSSHLSTVLGVFKMAVAKGAREAAEYARHEVPVPVIRAALPFANDEQRATIREALAAMQQ